jgi:hypothetical protein
VRVRVIEKGMVRVMIKGLCVRGRMLTFTRRTLHNMLIQSLRRVAPR